MSAVPTYAEQLTERAGGTRPPLAAAVTYALLLRAPAHLVTQPTSRAFREFAQTTLTDMGLPPITRGDLRRSVEWISTHCHPKAVQHAY